MAQAQGTIVQCVGAVTDIEFTREAMPKIYDALQLVDNAEGGLAEKGLIFEVEQQLGDGVVRGIALGSSDGLRRGMKVTNTGAPISVPVGVGTLGRIMDVLGRPIDEGGPIKSDKLRSIHQIAPKFDELSPSVDLLETGIKVIDLIWFNNFLIASGYNYFVDFTTKFHSFNNVLNHRLAKYLCKRFTRKPRACESRRNYRDNFHFRRFFSCSALTNN